MVKLVDTGDSKSPGESCASSSLATATIFKEKLFFGTAFFVSIAF